MTESNIDPLSLKFCEPRYFEDFAVGERFYLPSRTMTEGVFSAFQAASGDNHPIHYDRHYCKAQGHRDLLAHGFQVLIQACIGAGVLPQMMGPSLIGFLVQSARILNAGECGYFDRWNQIQPPTRRMNILGRFTQQFSDIWQVSFEGGFFRSESQQVRAPANTFTRGFQGLQVGPGTPPAFRDPLGATTIPSTNPSFPDAARAAGVDEGRLFYTFLDIGPRMTVSDAKQYRAVANLQGGFGEWDFESAIGYTKVDLDRTGLNSVDPRNLQAALNSTDAPYLVGQLNSAEVVAFITPPLKQHNESKLMFAHAGVSRSLFDLPGGPLGLALGVDYFKRDQFGRAPGPIEQGLTAGFSNSFSIGIQRVSSGYAEVVAPVADWLELDGAVRYDHYNISGGKASPKLGFRWQPFAEFAVRGTASKGFRAPGPSENGKAGQSFTAGASADPILCPNPNTPMAPGNFVGQCNVRVPGLQGTNEDVEPETSEAFTFGFIFEPLDQITASIDFYSITIDDQIVSGGPTTRVRNTNLEPLGRFQADGMPRLETPPVGTIAYDTISFINANKTETDGFDLTLRYQDSIPGLGEITSNFLWSFTHKYDLTIGGETFKLAGTHGPFFYSGNTGNPKTRIQWANTISRGAWELSGTLNFISSFDVTDPSSIGFIGVPQDTCLQALNTSGAGNRDYATALAAGMIPSGVDCKVDHFATFDVKAKYDVTEYMSVQASVLNLFDEEAPEDWQTYGASGGLVPFNPSFHTAGAIGRFFTIGVTYRFW